MQIRMKPFIKYALLLCLVSAVLICLMFFSSHVSTKEKDFIHSIQSQLHNSGDWVLVSDLNPSPWLYVCVKASDSLSGSVGPEIMQRKFGDMVLGIEKFPTAYATDASWLVIFFDPNKSVEYLSIPNDHIRGHGANHASNEEWPICKSRSDAIFMLTEIESQNGQKTTGITLTTKNHI